MYVMIRQATTEDSVRKTSSLPKGFSDHLIYRHHVQYVTWLWCSFCMFSHVSCACLSDCCVNVRVYTWVISHAYLSACLSDTEEKMSIVMQYTGGSTCREERVSLLGIKSNCSDFYYLWNCLQYSGTKMASSQYYHSHIDLLPSEWPHKEKNDHHKTAWTLVNPASIQVACWWRDGKKCATLDFRNLILFQVQLSWKLVLADLRTTIYCNMKVMLHRHSLLTA